MKIKQTKILESVFQLGHQEARLFGAEKITMDHLFLALLKQENGHGTFLLKKMLQEWEIYQITQRVQHELTQVKQKKNSANTIHMDPLLRISAEAEHHSSPVLNTAHLLQCIVDDKRSISGQMLHIYGINGSIIASWVKDLPFEENYYEDMNALSSIYATQKAEEALLQEMAKLGEEQKNEPNVKDTSILHSDTTVEKDSVLYLFGSDLTAAAEKGKIDPVIGRDEEIERLIQILGRRKKNNPVLIGEPGVGKSAIVEGLARRIVSKDVSESLQSKRIFSLDLSALVAGTKYRGQFEERINSLLIELRKHSDIILFIDEIHSIMSAGSTQGSLDAANILKPALARGEVQCIGATTLEEYRESIESDGALERRFQKIIVSEPTEEETLTVLFKVKEHYEKFHNVKYSDEAVRACVELSKRHLTERFFPDKAIDVMDEAGSRAHLQQSKFPQKLLLLEEGIGSVVLQKKGAIEQQNYELANTLRNKELRLRKRLKSQLHEWKAEHTSIPAEVDRDGIEEVIASISGIPTSRISQDEQKQLLGMNGLLSSKVIGQNEAADKITRTIQRSRVGLRDPERPMGVFLFVGPTGVGKTEMVKALTSHLFGSEEALIRVDMSEYSEKHNVSRLLGSPPGYVGYGEGGQLTEKVRRHPYSVVLFDEIEKAHPDLFNVMLQLFDEGYLTDGLGRRVDFRNTIIIMTSNIGSREIQQKGNSLGFETAHQSTRNRMNHEAVYRKNLERSFSPEFINRIDDIVIFNTLSNEDLLHIVELEISALSQRVEALGYKINAKKTAKECLVAHGYEPRYGVRSLKRSILDNIEEPLAEMIVSGKVQSGEQINISCRGGKIELSTAG